uniref:hypothetical protein n=1 Tax=Mycobacterium sp. TaxID=1785 RepID=UPI0026164B21
MGVIQPLAIPLRDIDPAALSAAAADLRGRARALRGAGGGMRSAWHGLAGNYRAPESATLLSVMNQPAADLEEFASDLDQAAAALDRFAVAGGAAARDLHRVFAEASAFTAGRSCDWQPHGHLLARNNELIHTVDAAVVAFMAAERECANAIEALIGGRQLPAADKHHPHGYGPASIPDSPAVPWGRPIQAHHKKSCATSSVDWISDRSLQAQLHPLDPAIHVLKG